jgi:SAM-dependent methyltransferase
MSNRKLFRIEQLPVFQNRMFSTAQEALDCTKGDVVLVQDTSTGLVSNAAFDAELLVYDADYQNEQACSTIFKQHLNDVTAIIERHFRDKTLIEVGCGKGHFLEHLRQLGYLIKGIDPAYEGASCDIVKAPFEKGLGLSADGVVLRHVLEHIQNPVGFLADVARANGGKGTIYIEVPCFDWICRHRAWFDVFYEHVNYFRLADFERMFTTVLDSGHLFGGQYLYVIAELSTLRSPCAAEIDMVDFPKDFLADVQRYATLLETQSVRSRRQRTIWGGASKGVIFSLYMQRSGVEIDFVIDINPAKQGKFLGASGLQVSSPEETLSNLRPGADIFVMNSNYLGEIVTQSGNRFNYLAVDQHEF